jgi:CspA family cold shock protein
MCSGTVKFFNESQGFGLISPDADTGEIFVDVSALQAAGIERLRHGQRVRFKVGLDRHGRVAARTIQLIPDIVAVAGGGEAHAR